MAPPPAVRDQISFDYNAMLMRCLDSISSQVHHQQTSPRKSDAEASIKPSLSEHRDSTTAWSTNSGQTISCAIRDAETESR
jgi:hypothetical protein